MENNRFNIKDLDSLIIYMDWYIEMLCLNKLINEKKVSKHKIYFNNLQEFKKGTINTSWKNNMNRVEHWKTIMDSRKYERK